MPSGACKPLGSRSWPQKPLGMIGCPHAHQHRQSPAPPAPPRHLRPAPPSIPHSPSTHTGKKPAIFPPGTLSARHSASSLAGVATTLTVVMCRVDWFYPAVIFLAFFYIAARRLGWLE